MIPLSNAADSPADLVVGIDAGGTTLRAAVARAATGASLAQMKGGPAPDGGPETVGLLLENVLRAAGVTPSRVGAVCAGITKWTRGTVRATWEAELVRLLPQAQGKISVVPDYVIGFHGAVTSGHGIAALAGTGSVAYGENEAGQSARVGGRGWEWGDEGSGTWITNEAIRRTLRALDGMTEMTPLSRAVCERLQTGDAGRVGEAARETLLRDGRGFLVPLILSLARERTDREAADLFVGAAGWLGAQVKAVSKTLEFGERQPVNIALVGGLWEAGDVMQIPFRNVVHRFLPLAQIILPQAAPVTGAVRLARALPEPASEVV